MVVLEKCKYVEKYYNVLENILSLKVTNAMLQPRYVSIQNLDPCKHQQNTLILYIQMYKKIHEYRSSSKNINFCMPCAAVTFVTRPYHQRLCEIFENIGYFVITKRETTGL